MRRTSVELTLQLEIQTHVALQLVRDLDRISAFPAKPLFVKKVESRVCEPNPLGRNLMAGFSSQRSISTHADDLTTDLRRLPKGTRKTTMPLKRESLERQLEQTQAVLGQVKADLIEQGVAESDLNKQPKYRDASGDLRTVKRRLNAVSAKEAITAGAGVSQVADDASEKPKKKEKKEKKEKKTKKKDE
jgi:hypothetical protein